MSNTIGVFGRVGSDPELKQVGQNDILEFRFADNVGFGQQKATNWYRVKTWGKQAVSLQSLIKKGDPLFITGELQNSEWTDKSGNKQTTLEIRTTNITLAGSKDDNAKSASGSASTFQSPNKVPVNATASDDDMPF